MSEIDFENKTMEIGLQKEKSFSPINFKIRQNKLQSRPTTSTPVPASSSVHVKSNTTLLHAEDSLKWRSDATMKEQTCNENVTLSDKNSICGEKHTKKWKTRKRMFTNKQNVLSLISKAYYPKVILQNSSYPLNFIIYISTFLCFIVAAHAQTSFSGVNTATVPGVSNVPDNRAFEGPEGFFFATNGSSSATIPNSLLSETSNAQFGLSFRTCTPGQLLKQVGNNLDVLKVEIKPDNGGSLQFSLNAQNGDYSITRMIGSSLLDAKWHLVLFQISPQNDKITINISGTPDTSSLNGDSSVNGDSVTISSQDVSEALSVLDLSRGTSPELRVGAGFVGCIREGPRVRFTKTGVSVISQHVKWGRGGTCLLPNTCAGRTKKILIETSNRSIIPLIVSNMRGI